MNRKVCLSKDRNGENCRFCCVSDTNFCKFHQYMISYSEEMLARLELCNGCKKMYCFDGELRTCETCRDRGKVNKVKRKEVVIMCSKEGCKFKKSEENVYCGKHQLCLFEDETRAFNKKLCYNYIRGCREQLDMDYGFSRCGICLEKERKKDKDKRNKAFLSNEKLTLDTVIITKKHCTSCCKELDIEHFTCDDSGFTKTCKGCRIGNMTQNKKRDKDHRNKVIRESTRSQYTEYKKNAFIRNLEFAINYDNYVSIVKNECNYCGILQEKGINGIDRVDSNIGYTLENCVSCCKTCNYMKRNLPVDIFIKKIEHILVYQNKIVGNLYSECFSDHNNVFYKSYLNRSKSKNLDFLINEEEFYSITKMNCYICGKSNNDLHKNGIDRFNNKEGYTHDNAKPCCFECNLMKGINSFNDMIDKFTLIHNRRAVS